MSSFAEDLYETLLKEGLSEEEIEDAMKQKKSEFGGFMTTQGMLFLIAKEHGINVQDPELGEVYQVAEEEIDYDEFTISISDVKEGMSNIVVLGKIVKTFRIHQFARNDGSIGMVGSFILQDSSDAIKIVAWDEQVKPLQSDYFREGTILRVIGEYCKTGREGDLEVHVGRRGKLILSPENVNEKTIKRLRALEPYLPSQSESPLTSLSSLMDENKFISKVEGTVHIEEFKEITLKSGEPTFLLKLLLTTAQEESARIIIWGDNAVQTVKMIEEGSSYRFHNLMVKDSSYTGEKELSFTRKSSISPY